MKKGLIAIVVAAVVAVGGAGGYMMYQKKAEEKAYNEEVKQAINSLPSIVVYEKEDLPTVESEFANAGSCIDINSVEPDISNVYTTEPGEYEVKYTFKDSKGEQRTATVPCVVKPELSMHVTGMKDIEIDKGDDLPTESGCEYDDQYVSSVTLNTENVDNAEVVAYNDGALEIRIRIGDMNYVDVSREASLKDQVLRVLNSKHGDVKFFSKDNKIIARAYFKKNASTADVDDLIATLSSNFNK